jgi:hypothetical protein
MRKFRVTLPISIVGQDEKERVLHPGDVVELDAETAVLYKHALLPHEEEK